MLRHRSRASLALATLVALLVAACADGGDGDRSAGPSTTATTAPASTPPGPGDTSTSTTAAAPPSTAADATGDPPRLRAERVAGFEGALALAVRAGDDALYVAEQGGRVKAVRGGRVDSALVLDLTDQTSAGGERGLLGLAFSPDGSRLYVDYTDRAGDTRVVEYAVAGGRADPSSRRQLLMVDQPFSNHNGGQLVVGPDGLLYIGLGDGGSGGDPDDNGQRLDTLLGKILRIDPRPAGDQPYTVPPDNPFVGREGARPEIWAYGLRNPWRFTFDRGTGALWIGDVGQGSREEISRADPASKGGENYGWNRFEGTRPFEGRAPADHVPPVFDYPTSGGNCAVTGGYVYRGDRIPALRGRYLFADFCAGRVMALVPDGGGMRSVDLGPRVASLSSFGEDAAGELYVLSLSGGLFRLEAA